MAIVTTCVSAVGVVADDLGGPFGEPGGVDELEA